MEKPKWMSDESVRHIEEEKLAFLCSLVEDGRTKSAKERMPFLFSKMKYAKEHQISFNADEIASVIAAIRKYSSAEEKEFMEEILKKAPK